MINLEDFIYAYFNQEPELCITYPEEDKVTQLLDPCENFTSLYKLFDVVDNKEINTIIHNQSFTDYPKELSCCIDFDSDVIL